MIEGRSVVVWGWGGRGRWIMKEFWGDWMEVFEFGCGGGYRVVCMGKIR